jgi:hypothetical protein
MQITNVSDTSFTVTYTTDDSVIGTLNMGSVKDNLDQTVLDDRDQLSQTVNKYYSHTISANSLTPNTTYYFTITSGSKKKTDNGMPFSIKTGPAIASSPSSQPPIFGRVINQDGSTPSDGIVLVNINGAQISSTYLKKDGTFLLPLNILRTTDLSNYLSLDANSNINIKLFSGGLSSKVSLSSTQISPVPIITLSNNYDLEQPNPTQKPILTPSQNFKNLKFPSTITKKRSNISPK